jgi:hypothetical protein
VGVDEGIFPVPCMVLRERVLFIRVIFQTSYFYLILAGNEWIPYRLLFLRMMHLLQHSFLEVLLLLYFSPKRVREAK